MSITVATGKRKFASYKSYSEIIRTLDDLTLCRGGCRANGWTDRLTHRSGYATINARVIHWQERRPTRRGLRNFLKLAAVAGIWPSSERWIDLYAQNVRAQQLAKRFGVRFPRAWSATDRARIRLWMARWTPSELNREFPEQRQLIRRIERWARA